MRDPVFCICAKLISAFVFATRIVQSLFFLNPKFQASRQILLLYSPVCVGLGRKPRRPIFSQRGSNTDLDHKYSYLRIVSIYNIENEKASRQDDTKAGKACHNDIQVLWNENFISVDNCGIVWYYAIYIVKLGFTGVHVYFFLIFALKHRLWYSLEPPQYPQSMF